MDFTEHEDAQIDELAARMGDGRVNPDDCRRSHADMGRALEAWYLAERGGGLTAYGVATVARLTHTRAGYEEAFRRAGLTLGGEARP